MCPIIALRSTSVLRKGFGRGFKRGEKQAPPDILLRFSATTKEEHMLEQNSKPYLLTKSRVSRLGSGLIFQIMMFLIHFFSRY